MIDDACETKKNNNKKCRVGVNQNIIKRKSCFAVAQWIGIKKTFKFEFILQQTI